MLYMLNMRDVSLCKDAVQRREKSYVGKSEAKRREECVSKMYAGKEGVKKVANR